MACIPPTTWSTLPVIVRARSVRNKQTVSAAADLPVGSQARGA